MFGDAFWDFTIIGVSHWAFDSNSIAERNHTGKNEEWFLAEWNKQFKDKFHMEKDLSGVFIDSWSQQPWNIEDPGQQDVFQVSFYLHQIKRDFLKSYRIRDFQKINTKLQISEDSVNWKVTNWEDLLTVV